jgi:glycosyltransferase involved in cell wall biosynthesis
VATIFSTNMNIFTSEEVSPLRHRVVSWGWRNPSQPAQLQRREMLDETRWALRRFPDADAIAHGYHSHKTLLHRGGAVATLRALTWTARAVRASDRVVLGAPPSGLDRALWGAAYLASRFFRVPIYLFSEDWLEPRGARFALNRWLRRQLRRDASHILVLSAVHRAHHISAGVPRERVTQIDSIYCPRPEPVKLLPARMSESPFTFLYVGRLVPYKGLARLLTIMRRMASGYDARLLVVAGRAEQYMGRDRAYPERCRRMIGALPRNTIELVEHVHDIERVYEQADALVMPNLVIPRDKVPAESWGRVVEEALHHRVPVISTDAVPAAQELIAEGVNGHVVPWQDDEELEQVLDAVAAGRIYQRP